MEREREREREISFSRGARTNTSSSAQSKWPLATYTQYFLSGALSNCDILLVNLNIHTEKCITISHQNISFVPYIRFHTNHTRTECT